MWWRRPAIPALRRLRQDGQELGVILGCVEKPYFKTKAETKQQQKANKKKGKLQGPSLSKRIDAIKETCNPWSFILAFGHS